MKRGDDDPKRAVVLGGGIIGVSTAYWLHRFGWTVTLVESAPQLGTGSSYANAGLICPAYCKIQPSLGKSLKMLTTSKMDWTTPELWKWSTMWLMHIVAKDRSKDMLKLLQSGSKLVKQSLTDYGIGALVPLPGLIEVSNSVKGLEALGAGYKDHKSKFGVSTQILSRSSLHEQEPLASNTSAVGGVYFPGVENYVLDCLEYTRALSGIGIMVQLETKAVGLEKDFEGNITGIIVEKGGVEQVVATDIVVCCLGVESAAFIKHVTSGEVSLPILPVKGHSVTLHGFEHSLKQCIANKDTNLYISPIDKTTIRATLGNDIVGLDNTIDSNRIAEIRQGLDQLFGKDTFASSSRTESWAGLRPCTPDFLPIIGPLPNQPWNLVVNTGHAFLGWSLAMSTGRLCAEMISNEPLSFRNPGIFSPSRFFPFV